MQLDLKPNELIKYNGSSFCPDDIDSFWDRLLEKMKSIEPNTQLKPTKWHFENSEGFDLYFTGMHGARLHANYLRPKNCKKSKVVFIFHGYSGKASDFFNLMSWANQGYCVASLDCRGQAGNSEDVGGHKWNTLHGHIIRGIDGKSPEELLFTDVFLDVAQLVEIVKNFDEVDENNMFAFGGSQGGALTYVCASLCKDIKGACALYPFLSDYKRVWEMDMAERAYSEIKEYFRNFDPRHEREDEIFEKLSYIDISNLSHRIKGKMLMLTGLMDDICPPSTQFAAYNKITSEKKYILYPDFGHEGLPDCELLAMDWFKNA